MPPKIDLQQYKEAIENWHKEGYTSHHIQNLLLSHHNIAIHIRTITRTLRNWELVRLPRLPYNDPFLRSQIAIYFNLLLSDAEMEIAFASKGHTIPAAQITKIRKKLGLYRRRQKRLDIMNGVTLKSKSTIVPPATTAGMHEMEEQRLIAEPNAGISPDMDEQKGVVEFNPDVRVKMNGTGT